MGRSRHAIIYPVQVFAEVQDALACMKLTGPFQTVFTHPTTGEELASFDGTVVLTRITVGK